MMRNIGYINIILLLFQSAICFSQKKYEFDYVLEYVNQNDTLTKPQFYFRFTNSKDNSYTLTVTDKDENIFQLYLIDVNGKEYAGEMKKADFLEVDKILLKCPMHRKYVNPDKEEHLEEYMFSNLSDTLINKKLHKHYVIKYKGSKEENLGTIHYIIENGSELHAPNFFPYSPAYTLWEAGTVIPNGIYKKAYRVGPHESIKEETTLIQYAKIKKIIITDTDCNN